MSTTPHGWYPDPHDERSMRWWDGHAWTHHVQPRPTESAPSTEPPRVTEPAPPIEPPPVMPTGHPVAAPGGVGDEQPRGGSSGPALAIVAAVVVLALGIGIAVFATGRGTDDVAAGGSVPDTTEPPAPPSPDEASPEGGTPPQDDGSDDGQLPPPGGASTELAAVEGHPVVTGSPLPPNDGGADPAADPAVGQPVPRIEGAAPDGTPVSFGGAGEPHLVLMVASWCPACHAQLPEFAQWRAQGGDGDVEVVVVVTLLEPDRPGWPADEWAVEEGIPADLLMDDRYGSVANAFGLYAVPYWVVIDAEGRLVQRQAGVIEPERIAELAEAARAGAG